MLSAMLKAMRQIQSSDIGAMRNQPAPKMRIQRRHIATQLDMLNSLQLMCGKLRRVQRWLVADIRDMPFQSSSFDLVIDKVERVPAEQDFCKIECLCCLCLFMRDCFLDLSSNPGRALSMRLKPLQFVRRIKEGLRCTKFSMFQRCGATLRQDTCE